MTTPPNQGAEEAMLPHLIRIAQALAGRLDFQSAIRAVAEEVGQFLGYDHFDICIMTERAETLVAYETGFTTIWSKESPAPTAASPIRALLWGEVPYILTDDAPADPRFQFEGALNRPIFEEGLRSRLHVALRVQGSIIGALNCSCRAPGRYTRRDVERAQLVADLVAPYVFALRATEEAKAAAIQEAETRARAEGLRLGALHLTAELELERQRIGMDLHDQTLADLTRLLHRIGRLAENGGVPAAALAPIATQLRGSIVELRRIIDNARPNVLRLFGFEQGLEDLLVRTTQASPSTIETRVDNEIGGWVDAQPEPLRVALFRIAQEAVNNAVLHAEARCIAVRLARDEGGVAISITDDGRGFHRREARRLGGIDNMRTRARLVGAEFRIDTPPGGRGTRVTVVLPADAQRAAE